jgi:hypothetical protein
VQKDNAMTDSQRTKITAAQTLEAIGLNDPTVAALLKELKENAMTWQYREPNGEWQMFSAPALPTVKRQKMGSPIFDSTFGTGRFKDEKFTDPPRPDASAKIADLQERCAEAQRLAFEWMERHDKVVGFISKNYPAVMIPNLPFPSPVSRPDASAGIIHDLTDDLGLAEWASPEDAEKILRNLIAKYHRRLCAADRSGK